MTRYHVNWEIELDAEDAEHAAERALEFIQDPDSSAKVFTVADLEDEDQQDLVVDLHKQRVMPADVGEDG